MVTPKFMKMTLSTCRRPSLAIALSGACSTCPAAFSSTNTGLSESLRRMIIAPTVTNRLLQKMARQPHASRASSGSSWASTQTSAPIAVPRAAPIMTNADSCPRLPRRATSVSRVAPPDCSAPAPKPCRNRHSTSRIGARTPALAKVGRQPMPNVAAPISNSVVTSTHLRPNRSPKWEKNSPPSGRAANPIA